MAISDYEKQIRKIIKTTKINMTDIGTYKPQFDPTIRVYAETKYQYNLVMREFLDSGCKMTEEYTNKFGATNIRKTAIYLALETIRKDILGYENILGLTPAGLKKINDGMKSQRKKGGLAEVLNGIK